MTMTAAVNQKIPEGYKQTELGVIPADWDIKSLGEVVDVVGGGTPSTAILKYWNGSINWFTPTEIGNEKYVYKSKRKISDEGLKNSSAKILNEGTVLLTSRAGIGDLAILKIRACTNQGFQSLIPKNQTNSEFLYYLMLTKKRDLLDKASGSTFLEISPNSVRNILIQLPKPSEQTVIATVLSDTDELIEKLKKLIEKKKKVKKGAMQELLTGKRRLSGFSGGWEEKKISDVCGKITTGKLNANAMAEGGEYRFYTCAKDYYQIDRYAFDTEALLVSGNGANVGYIHYYKGKFNAYQRTYVLSDFSADIQYIKLFMDRNLQERIRVEVNAGNTPYITMGTLTDMQIMIPPTKKEQTSIAQVLSDMDVEIDELKSQLAKYKNIKQGMMQQLLTGKIRLIKK